ncbi:MAG: hypothetical protein ACR2IV_14455 [Bryobacteraceae bacterium]
MQKADEPNGKADGGCEEAALPPAPEAPGIKGHGSADHAASREHQARAHRADNHIDAYQVMGGQKCGNRLHDDSVPSLDNLLDPSRGPTVPSGSRGSVPERGEFRQTGRHAVQWQHRPVPATPLVDLG